MREKRSNSASDNLEKTVFRLPVSEETSLVFNPPSDDTRYPTDKLQKGWLLADRGKLLTEEGTGFGMPIVKYGRQTVFPGEAKATTRKTSNGIEITVTYFIDTVQRLGIKGKPKHRIATINRAREFFSTMHRRFPQLRRPLDALSSVFQNTFRLEPIFEKKPSVGSIIISYHFNQLDKRIIIEAQTDSIEKQGCTEIIIANEQGARFNRYTDSNGVQLQGEEIGSWDEVNAEWASLGCTSPPITFTVDNIAGARLFRGREERAGRLAWAGLNYVLSPSIRRFSYEIRISEAASR
jgi:hypothetical protein